jgi:hypothetical protein
VIGGAIGAGAGLLGALALNKGGEIPHMVDGGALAVPAVQLPSASIPSGNVEVPQSPNILDAAKGSYEFTKDLMNLGKKTSANKDITSGIRTEPGGEGSTDLAVGGGDEVMAARGGSIYPGPHRSHVANYLHGGMAKKVEAMVSPGEIYLTPEKVHMVIKEGANPLKIGEKIGGKAKVKGDSLKNDTVPRALDEGGIVIPRHVATKMSREKAELFVHRAFHGKK